MAAADLIALGAPALPDGYFYRVRRGRLTGETYVHVRRSGRFFSWLVCRDFVRLRSYDKAETSIPVDVAVLTAACRAHAVCKEELRLAYWSGDHR